jgi:hypothetical protein
MEKMSIREAHLARLRVAEQQFRLACTVHLAVTNGVQTLDVPVEWAFGRHRVSYEDFGLRQDQADYAASQLEMTATFVIASAIRDALVALFPDTKQHTDQNVVSAYQISRLIRNAFAHNMTDPLWSIDADCRDSSFEIERVIRLNTSGLDKVYLDWRHYGGPLAIFYLGRYVREILLHDPVDPNRAKPPYPSLECYQQGRLILQRIDKLPEGVIKIASAGPGERLEIGDDHWIEVPLPANNLTRDGGRSRSRRGGCNHQNNGGLCFEETGGIR